MKGKVKCMVCGSEMPADSSRCPFCHTYVAGDEKTVSFEYGDMNIKDNDKYYMSNAPIKNKYENSDPNKNSNKKNTVEVNPAGLGLRILAFFIDLLLVIFFTSLVWSIAGFAMSGYVAEKSSFFFSSFSVLSNYASAREYFVVLLIICYFGYQSWFNVASDGASIGRMFLGIRVIAYNGKAPSLMRTIVREIAVISTFILFMIGFLWYFVGVNHQTLHDIIAGTIVEN